MNETEQSASGALPLAAAAARLGISSDALRMRINRGKIKGFKKGGRLFAVLEEAPGRRRRTTYARTEQTDPARTGRFEQARDRPASFRKPRSRPAAADSGAPQPPLDEPSLPLVVEFQKVELTRLLRDNARLNRRFDQLFEELRHLREMQQREQVLRQQDQTLRQRAQAWIERLTAPPESTPPESAPIESAPIESAPIESAPIESAPIESAPLAPTPPVPQAPDPEVTGPQAGSSESAAESAAESAPESAPAPADAPRGAATKPAEAIEAGGSGDGTRRDGAPREPVDLADMLKDIGAALRNLDSAAEDADAPARPIAPPPAPPPAPSIAAPGPPPVPGARRTPGDLAGPPPGPPPSPPGDDEAGLLEILGRMGPSAEERRTAARLMKRLFKGRATRRRREPGDDVPGGDVI